MFFRWCWAFGFFLFLRFRLSALNFEENAILNRQDFLLTNTASNCGEVTQVIAAKPISTRTSIQLLERKLFNWLLLGITYPYALNFCVSQQFLYFDINAVSFLVNGKSFKLLCPVFTFSSISQVKAVTVPGANNLVQVIGSALA